MYQCKNIIKVHKKKTLSKRECFHKRSVLYNLHEINLKTIT